MIKDFGTFLRFKKMANQKTKRIFFVVLVFDFGFPGIQDFRTMFEPGLKGY